MGTGQPRADQIRWVHELSADPRGRVFVEDGHYCRAVYPEGEGYVRKLFRRGVFDALVADGHCPPVELIERRVAGCNLILRSPAADFSVPGGLYTRSMIRAAAIRWLDINMLLTRFDLRINDSDIRNFALFGNCDPKWVDFGAISPARGEAPDVNKFVRYLLSPLLLIARSPTLLRVARLLMAGDGTTARELHLLTGRRIVTEGGNLVALLTELRELIDGLEIHRAGGRQQPVDSESSAAAYRESYRLMALTGSRQALLDRLLRELACDRSINLMANPLACGHDRVLAATSLLDIDNDEPMQDRYYLDRRGDANRRLAIACLNTGADRVLLSRGLIECGLSATLMLNFGLPRLFVRYRRIGFQNIAKVCGSIAERHCLIDFPDQIKSKDGAPPPEWYALDRFLDDLRPQFRELRIVDRSDPAQGTHSTLVLATK